MDYKIWLRDAIHSIFQSNDDEVVSIAYVKAILTAIGEQLELDAQPILIPLRGTERSTRKKKRPSKAQREAEALRQMEDD